MISVDKTQICAIYPFIGITFQDLHRTATQLAERDVLDRTSFTDPLIP